MDLMRDDVFRVEPSYSYLLCFHVFLLCLDTLGIFLLCLDFDSDSASVYKGTRMICTQLHNTSKTAVSHLTFRPILP